jgi:diaminopimelate epimerase
VTPAARSIPFVKVSAYGNDFLLIDAAFAPAPEDISAFTRRICDRHNGVGADGIEWMSTHFSADVEIRLINSDGTPAEISGNGTRCVAAYVCSMQHKDRISILTGAGIKVCTLTSRRDSEYEFEAEMGKPVVGAEFSVKTLTGEVRGIPVSMGNPHYVILVDEFTRNWQAQAAEIQAMPQFPEGVNVIYAVIDSKFDVRVRIFERGAGETSSSGTGSCSAAVAAMSIGRTDSTVKVHAPGGTQTVRRVGENILLRGLARIICRGEFFLS